MTNPRRKAWTLALAVLIVATAAFPQRIHEEYTKKIRELTTEKAFLTKWIDYLPAGNGVPSPLEVLGRIAGAPNVLSYSDEVYKYFDALDKASARVKVFRLEKTEEGRDWIVAAIGDEASIRDLERYKQMTARLADPRQTTDAEAAAIIAKAKPIYWATGGMHSSETGSVEMLMELAYRLAVDEAPLVRTIRDNAIVLITPILEVDGRDKYVDVAMALRKDPQTTITNRLLYWGKYVAHDNNRDNIGQALVLTRNILKTALDYHPQVMHDLHESAAHLYISTGSGPYNPWLDPIVIDEWHQMAYHEINTLTREGVPGVWSHTFYDGWAPNYAFYAANGHNAIGRFYETQGAGDGSTRIINNSTDRTWYKPNPPLAQVVWSIRNNVNLQQSALLVAIHNVAANKTRFLENFWLKGKRSVAKARAEGPAAYVLPASDPRPGLQARLLRLLQGQGVEVHKTDRAFKAGPTEYPAGSYVVRMDQPYSRMADMLLDKQYFNTADGRPYDDVGWQLGPQFNVRTDRVTDAAVLAAPMSLVTGPVKAPGGVVRPASGAAAVYLINHNADNALATFRFKAKDLKIHAAEKAFEAEGRTFNAGTFILKPSENGAGLEAALDAAGKELGLAVVAAAAAPAVPTHELVVPRIALIHTWQSTQSEGWVRIALDELAVPYDYVSVHAVRDTARLRDKWDVILIGPSSGDAWSLVNGNVGDKATAWKTTAVTPNIGVIDSTDDIRGGIELEGVMHLRNFMKEGGLLITLTNSSILPIHFGFAPGIAVRTTPNLIAGGSVFKADVSDKTSPIVYGYDDSLGVYFSQAPVFGFGSGAGMGARGGVVRTGRASGRGDQKDPDIPQGRPLDLGKQAVEEFRKANPTPAADPRMVTSSAPRPRTIMNFARSAADLLIAGGLTGGEELAGAPALIDSQVGSGHAVLFAFNPMWRHQTHGSFALVTNAMLNWRNLTPPPAPPAAPAKPALK